MNRIRATALCAVACVAMTLGMANAQQPQNVRIRGTIESVDGNIVALKNRDGQSVKVSLADDGRVFAFIKSSLADVKPNSYVGITAMAQPDGSQKAIAIHIFMESQRGVGEGHRSWDLRPNSTMTNGAVDTAVSSVDGQVLMLKYKDGEKKVLVTSETQIVAYADGNRNELQPGASVNFFAQKQSDGTLTTRAINFGRGIVPPM